MKTEKERKKDALKYLDEAFYTLRSARAFLIEIKDAEPVYEKIKEVCTQVMTQVINLENQVQRAAGKQRKKEQSTRAP